MYQTTRTRIRTRTNQKRYLRLKKRSKRKNKPATSTKTHRHKKTGGEPPSKLTDELLRNTMYAAHAPMSNVNEGKTIEVIPNYGDAFKYTHTHKIPLEKGSTYYIPIPPINEGGFGKIYNYNETMVLKVTCKNRFINDSLRNELRMNTLIQNIDCKNIAKIYEQRETKKNFYILIHKYVNSIDVYYTQPANQDEQKLIEHLCGILNGLNVLHNNDIPHCDLKPQNVMIDNDNNAVIIDFGASKHINTKPKHSLLSVVISFDYGTDTYKSPERKKSQKYDRKKDDIFAFGCILEYLCKLCKFENNETLNEVIKVIKMTKYAEEFRPNASYLRDIFSTIKIKKSISFQTHNEHV